MFGTIVAILASISAFFFGAIAFIKYIAIIQIRIDASTYKTIYQYLKDNQNRLFIISEEISEDVKYPISFSAFIFFKDCPWFYLSHSERLLTNFQGKDYVTNLICFRWSYSKLKTFLLSKAKEEQQKSVGVSVELLLPYYSDKIGILKKYFNKPLLDEKLWKDIDEECSVVFSNNDSLSKTSCILYGPPGNGKTSFVKYLATKYKVPIKIITLQPKYTNHDLMLIFSKITKNCIVLFEDFDNYFDNRNCIIGNGNNGIQFTFDIILNGLDGVYNSYENVVFIMTANNISKIDSSLRQRPSRFKYIKNFDNPDLNNRIKLLKNEEIAKNTEGFSIDQILRVKEFLDKGFEFYDILKNLNKKAILSDENIAKIAYKKYEYRISKNLAGDKDTDWYDALKDLSYI